MNTTDNYSSYFPAVAIFLLAALLLAGPALFRPGARVIGNIEHPGLQGEIFHQWDFLHNARSGNLARYYYSDQIAYPGGQDLRENIGFSLHLFFYLPLIWLNDLIVSYNVLVIITLALNGFCAYLLGRHLTKTFWPAMVCGLFLMFSPYSLFKLELGFLQKYILWWLPLYVLCLLRLAKEKRGKFAFLAGLFWSCQLLTYAPYAYYAALATIVLSAYHLVKSFRGFLVTLSAGWPFVIPVIFSVGLLAVIIPGAGITHPETPEAIEIAPVGSVDIFQFVRFFPYHNFLDNVAGLPLGLSPLGIILALVALRRRMPYSRLFVFLAGLFLVLAAGPYLSGGGRLFRRIPMPYYFLASDLPWGGRLGFPIRALPLYELAVGVLSGLALSPSRTPGPGAATSSKIIKPASICAGLIILLILERRALLPELFPPVVTRAALDPDLEWLRRNGGPVIHLPADVPPHIGLRYSYISARTRTKMVNEYHRDKPLVSRHDHFPAGTASGRPAFLQGLNRIGVKYIIVHTDLIGYSEDDPDYEHPEKNPRDHGTPGEIGGLREWCGEPVRSGSSRLIVYRVPGGDSSHSHPRRASGADYQHQLLLSEARRAGWPDDPGIRERVNHYRDRLLIDELLRSQVYAGIEVPEAELKKFHLDNPELFERKEQIRVLHFLVPLPFTAGPEEKSEARDRAYEILDIISSGVEAAFRLAEELTRADPAGRRWGDIGYFSRGTFGGNIDDRLFNLSQVGECALVQSEDGFHIFRLMDIRPGTKLSFEEARPAVEDLAPARAKEDAAGRYIRKLAERAPLPREMVFIPGGTFWMGSTEEEIDRAAEMAKRFVGRIREVDRAWFEDEEYLRVRAGPFYIDKYEVTLAEYQAFLEATGHRALPDWVPDFAPSGDYPVVGLSWDDACAYCQWEGKRLPTAEEWEWAARGPERRRFPWGDGFPDGTRANYADASTDFPWKDQAHNDNHPRLAPVGSYPAGATPEGVMDMAGNVREWTGTARQGFIDPKDNHIWLWSQRHQVSGSEFQKPVIMYGVRGGGWDNAADDMRCSDVRMLPPDTLMPSLGFRCIK